MRAKEATCRVPFRRSQGELLGYSGPDDVSAMYYIVCTYTMEKVKCESNSRYRSLTKAISSVSRSYPRFHAQLSLIH